MATFKVYMNAGIEWETTIEAESIQDAEAEGYNMARAALGDLQDYNFSCEVTPL